ncbi:prosaposin isoform X2 [Microcaecilia unicolor]|uniref:Prosaposin isoform X2 n=1 Tax=Microcaecilia unicolor TaxID=1415580 RepID=A0A6P7Y830_9AMPH|nr:prosaposin isoform X2 [Microcaecilia unicolor]
MKQLFILPVLLTAVVALPLLGKEQCAKGPEIWCQNIHTASQCGAVNHCRQMVWSKPTVKTMPCELCKEVITVIQQFLKENGTQMEIQSYLKKICEFLPIKHLGEECKDSVDQYLPVLFTFITEELDNPTVVCSSLHLCTSLQQQQLQSNEIPEVDMSQVISPFIANVPLLLYPQEKSEQELQGDDKLWKECVQLITDLQESLKNNLSFADALIAQVKKDCDQMAPGFADLCKNYIYQYSGLAIQFLTLKQPKDICCIFGICPDSKSVPLQTLVPAKVRHTVKENTAKKNTLLLVKDLSLCVVCELVMKEVVNLLQNNKTEERIKEVLDHVCEFIPEPYGDQCVDFVNQYLNAIIQILLQETSPKFMCEMLGLCAANTPFLVERITPEQLRSGEFCKVCELLMSYLDIILQKNYTEKMIEDALHKVCNFLPVAQQHQCNQLVAQYADEILQLLLQTLDPGLVCTQLHFCVSEKKPILGSEVCVQGPGYWCKSFETAAQCNAIEHCKLHVWN